MTDYTGVAETSLRLVSLLRSPLEDDPEDFMHEELGQLADAIGDSLGIDPDRFGMHTGTYSGELSAQLDIHPFVWRNGDRIVVRYALDMSADHATITETIGGLPVNTLFTGTSLAAVSEFVTLLDDVL